MNSDSNHETNSNPESFYVNQYNRHPSNDENENETTDTTNVNVNVYDNIMNANNNNSNDGDNDNDDDDEEEEEEEDVLNVVSMEYDIMLGTMGHNDPTSPKFYSTWCRRLVPIGWNCNRCCNGNRNGNRNGTSCSSCQRILCCNNKSSQSLSAAAASSTTASSSEEQTDSSSNLNLDDIPEKPSNEELLSVAFLSFLTFTIAQATAAHFAHSDAMMGDSMAMFIDAFTYGFNLVAERMKNKNNNIDIDIDINIDSGIIEAGGGADADADLEAGAHAQAQAQAQAQADLVLERKRIKRKARKLKLILEIVPPMISVTTLISVTIYILHENINALVGISYHDYEYEHEHDHDHEQGNEDINAETGINADNSDTPNVIVMIVFSSLNLFVDFINVLFFAKADHAFGYDTLEEDVHDVVEYEHEYEHGHGHGHGHGYGYGYDHDDEDNYRNRNLNDYDGFDYGEDNDGPLSTPRRIGSSDSTGNGNGSNSGGGSGGKKNGNRKGRTARENYKRILNERRRKRGGAYAHIDMSGGDDDDDDNDNDDDRNNRYDGNDSNGNSNDNGKSDANDRNGENNNGENDTFEDHVVIATNRNGTGQKFKLSAWQVHNEDDDDDKDQDNNGTRKPFLKEQETDHDPTMFSIDDDDDDDDNDGFKDAQSHIHAQDDIINNTSAQSHSHSRGLDRSSSIIEDDEEAERYIAQYEQKKDKANLNMCSAYTHVFADTIRSIAVLIAAILGQCVHSITPEVADASASIVVSAVILFALLPLIVGMTRTFYELLAIWREEASERELERILSIGSTSVLPSRSISASVSDSASPRGHEN